MRKLDDKVAMIGGILRVHEEDAPVAIEQRQRIPVARKRTGHCGADPRRSTGDHGDSALAHCGHRT